MQLVVLVHHTGHLAVLECGRRRQDWSITMVAAVSDVLS